MAQHKDFVVEYQDMKIFMEKYELHSSIIGKGAFGKVKKATVRANQELRAVKKIDKLTLDEPERIRLKYEIDILKNLAHPNIVRLYEVCLEKNTLHFVFEYLDLNVYQLMRERRKLFPE